MKIWKKLIASNVIMEKPKMFYGLAYAISVLTLVELDTLTVSNAITTEVAFAEEVGTIFNEVITCDHLVVKVTFRGGEQMPEYLKLQSCGRLEASSLVGIKNNGIGLSEFRDLHYMNNEPLLDSKLSLTLFESSKPSDGLMLDYYANERILEAGETERYVISLGPFTHHEMEVFPCREWINADLLSRRAELACRTVKFDLPVSVDSLLEMGCFNLLAYVQCDPDVRPFPLHPPAPFVMIEVASPIKTKFK